MTRTARRERSFGVVGGLAPAADRHLLERLAAEAAARPDAASFEFAYDARLAARAGEPHATTSELLMRVYDGIDAFEARGVGTAVLPLFLEPDFAGELQSNSPLPIVEPVGALRAHVRAEHPRARRLGVLDPAARPRRGPYEPHVPAGEDQLLLGG
ncbi:MAG: aspartate racemase, partial [Pseudomonadota bacterium]